jgi:hypothetical protein
MINNPELLAGPVTIEAVKVLIDLAKTKLMPDKKLGNLTIFENTIAEAGFYGVEVKGLTHMGIIGRWGLVKFPTQAMIIKRTLDGDDATEFEKIFSVTPDSIRDKIIESQVENHTRRHSAGMKHVGEIAEEFLGGIMVIACAEPYNPEIHGMEIIETDSLN